MRKPRFLRSSWGLPIHRPEKMKAVGTRKLWRNILSSPVRELENRELAGISRDFRSNAGRFLCSADCVAERKTFEPSVRFCHANSRRVRKLQIAKPQQRISHQNPPQGLAISPVLVRRPFATLTRPIFCTRRSVSVTPPQ